MVSDNGNIKNQFLQTMTNKLNKTIEATNGYKTKGAAFIFLLFQMFGDYLPLNPGQQQITLKIIEVLIASGILHDLWRNRMKIIIFIQNLFTNKN